MKFFKKRGVALAVLVLSIAAAVCIGQSRKAGYIAKQPVTLPEVNAFTVGQLLFLFQLETAFAGELLDINAFDQPGVEEGKNATYALLGKHGYDEKKKELDAAPKKEARYII